MACIDKVPNCGTDPAVKAETTLAEILAAFGIVGSIASAIIGLLSASSGAAATLSSILAALGGASASGALAGLGAVLAVIGVIVVFGLDRCQEGEGRDQCIAGAVTHIEEAFDDASSVMFPFAAQHARVDVVVKSAYWDFVEQGALFVHCNGLPFPHQSVIMRCYYYTKAVCNAVAGSLYGAAIGGAAGIVAGAFVAAAIIGAAGCATVILCVFALLLAALIAAAAALIGAFAGGNIANAASSGSSDPQAGSGEGVQSGNKISVRDLVTVRGNMQAREHDDGANVLWWVHGSSIHGRLSDDAGLATFGAINYCDVNDELPIDGCRIGERDPDDGRDDDPPAPPEPPR